MYLIEEEAAFATRIANKDGIWEPKPSDTGMAETHDKIKNISEKLEYR